ncbi:MAG TPA: glycosyltransferase family 2 protein [Chitinophagaceae bacterium]|nr:glycosyltransferase family 2 protein [Chitinophagaceae bacterium]
MFLISTIIPIYNSSDHLGRCLDSLLTAQIDNVNNEIILVNDGSTDNSLEICEQYAKKHKNLKVLSQSNQGPSAARNLGIENAVGEYITFVDSDDYVEKDYCKEILSAHKSYPNVDIITFGYFKVENNKRKENYSVSKFDEIIHNKEIKNLLKNTVDYGFLLFPVNKLYKKSLILSSSLFPTNIRLGEDTIFNLKLFYNATNIVFVKKSIYNYYYNEKSVTSQKYKPDLIKRMAAHFQLKLDFYKCKSDLNNKLYFKDIGRINLEKTFYAFLGNSLANPNLDFIEELKHIRELDLIKFGFKYCEIKDINGVKRKTTLWLFKNRFYNILKLIYS